ncbi:hypothetical protein [Pseudomonas syringae]|uniref:hypothetical protein n=1 Tax=Pseudomonas syringae TaxID=317 RepID=UPI001F398891|nr:hypothetical protein [Pseudomonas syringae]MCF5371354.1 hypothetical protein [Pseudomonas syringae]
MKNIKLAVQRHLQSLTSALDESPKICHRAFKTGFFHSYVPRTFRRLLAGSEVHRYWVRGKLTKCLKLDGSCYAAEGRKLPFSVDLCQMPEPFRLDIKLVLSLMLMFVMLYIFFTS